MDVLQHDQFINRIYGSQKNRKFLRLYNPASTSSDSELFLDKYRDFHSPHEGNIPRSLKYSSLPNNFGDHFKDTTTDELVPSHIEQQCVPVSTPTDKPKPLSIRLKGL